MKPTVQTLKISDLIPNPANYNTHPDEQVAELARMISEFGFLVPVVIDTGNMIRAGHGRYLAAKRLGMVEIPCMVADGLTDAQLKAFAIAENKISKKSVIDFKALANEMEALLNYNYDLALTGHDDAEISALLQSVDDFMAFETTRVKEHERRIEAKPEPIVFEKIPIVAPGDVWDIGDTKIIVGVEHVATIESIIELWQKRTKREATNQSGLTFAEIRENV